LGISKIFKVEGITYELCISNLGQIDFVAIGGATRRGPLELDPVFHFGEYQFSIDDTNIMTAPFKVFNVVGKIIVNWAGATKPHTFKFASSTKRKIGIYRYLANKLLKKVKGYVLVEYPPGTFSFYKQVY
jgi:hypothetical protein